VRLLNAFDNSFPSGFVASIRAAAESMGYAVDVDDQRTNPVSRDENADLGWLRDYQREAVEKAVKAQRGILWMPTGAGKTEVAAALARALPCSWLFIVPQADLLYQTAERFTRRTGEEAGIVGDGEWSEARFTVATFQTLAAAIAGRSSVEKQQGLKNLRSRLQLGGVWSVSAFLQQRTKTGSNSFLDVATAHRTTRSRRDLRNHRLGRSRSRRSQRSSRARLRRAGARQSDHLSQSRTQSF
jgi:hypothetical protein